MKKTLIIIDMQNDFITGSLANPAAQAIVKPICSYINSWAGSNIILTRDTHHDDYLKTPEGEALPIEHCIEGTAGWCVVDEIQKTVRNVKEYKNIPYCYVDKTNFAHRNWNALEFDLGDEIILVGTCTDICVLSNALYLKILFPNKTIKVIRDLCAGVTPEKHNAALEVMRSCQIEVI